jgi:hypothetical protein
MQLIETKTLGADAASIEFTSIPQDGTDLVALFAIRSPRAANQSDTAIIRFNSNSSSYSGRELIGDGSAAYSFTLGTTSLNVTIPAASATSNTFGNASLYLANYTGATNKSASSDWVMENNATLAYQGIGAHLWSNTAAITSISFAAANGDLLAGSTVSLYKVTKGSDGIVTTS